MEPGGRGRLQDSWKLGEKGVRLGKENAVWYGEALVNWINRRLYPRSEYRGHAKASFHHAIYQVNRLNTEDVMSPALSVLSYRGGQGI